MKRLLKGLCFISLIFGLTACGSSDEVVTKGSDFRTESFTYYKSDGSVTEFTFDYSDKRMSWNDGGYYTKYTSVDGRRYCFIVSADTAFEDLDGDGEYNLYCGNFTLIEVTK